MGRLQGGLMFVLTLAYHVRPVITQYTLTVKTGLSWAAGTDATVLVRLGAESGNWSGILQLKNNRNNFEHAGTDHFTLETDYLGPICHLTVWMVNKGLFADWELDQIILHDNTTTGDSVFDFNKWMSSEENATTKINGRWGEWSPWSECSRSCGGGRKVRVRTCDRPPPACGGVACTGRPRQRAVCAKEECPTTTTAATTTTTTTTEIATTTPATTTEIATTPPAITTGIATTPRTITTGIATTPRTITTGVAATSTIPPTASVLTANVTAGRSSTAPVIHADARGSGDEKVAVRVSLTLPPLIMPSSPGKPSDTTAAADMSSAESSKVKRTRMTDRSSSTGPYPWSSSSRHPRRYVVTERAKSKPGTTTPAIATTYAEKTWRVQVTRPWRRRTTTTTTTVPGLRRSNPRRPVTPRRRTYDWRHTRPRPTHSYRHTTTYRPLLRLPIEHRFPYPRRTTTTTTTTPPPTTTPVPQSPYHSKRYVVSKTVPVTTETQRSFKPTPFLPRLTTRRTGFPTADAVRPTNPAREGGGETDSRSTFTTPVTSRPSFSQPRAKPTDRPPSFAHAQSARPPQSSVRPAKQRTPEPTTPAAVTSGKPSSDRTLTTTQPHTVTKQPRSHPRIEKLRTSVDASRYFTERRPSLVEDDVITTARQTSARQLDVTIRSRIIQKDSPTQERNPSTRSSRHPPVRSVMGESRRPTLPVYVIVLICIAGVIVVSAVIVSVYCAVVKSKIGHAAVTAAVNTTFQTAVPAQSNSYPMAVRCVPR